MKIESLKDLEYLVKLCRKTGIQSIKVDGVELHLGPEPTKKRKAEPFHIDDPLAHAKIEAPSLKTEVGYDATFNGMSVETKAEIEKIVTDELTPEQLMNWSVREDQPN
jgi:hypothetical protein